MLYEELPSHDYPISQTSQNSMRPLKDYVLKLSITINILIIWSAKQGIISFQIGKNFNSSLLIAFALIFTTCQLLFNKWHEVIFTLIIALMFVVYAIILGWTYLQNEKSNIGSEILYSSEIEDLEEE
ncbi:unnamed protein product [Rhizophagus irregularis]|nr:unnamed protein product [Rhizophagus irregularis]CAB5367668.1 unnamed protein product [Rhizophagus irregularis]